jgi:oxygen-dependent protoporphyrinogen oxidase
MGALVEALSTRINNLIRYDSEVTGLTLESRPAGPQSRWRIELADGTCCFAHATLCTTPAFITARLLERYDDSLAGELRAISYASAAVVNLGFRTTDFSASPEAFGFVVPIVEGRKIIAGSFSSLKFAGRAPAGMVLARAFLGGGLQGELLALDDDALLEAARSEFRSLLGVTAEPRFADLRRWPDAMPQYTVGHPARVSSIRARAANLLGLFLAGAYLDGVGIPDCVRMGEAAAEAALSHVRALAAQT